MNEGYTLKGVCSFSLGIVTLKDEFLQCRNGTFEECVPLVNEIYDLEGVFLRCRKGIFERCVPSVNER